MVFRFYSNALSQASRSLAAAIMIVGLLLIGFGVLIAALPEFFAYLAAGVFFLAGLGCGVTAIKIFWTQSQIDRAAQNETEVYRENVRIHVHRPDEL
jgi:fatty acid desaturase